MKNRLTNNERYLIKLLKGVLLSEEIEEKPRDVSFEEVFQIARAHSVANLSYYSISKLREKPEKNLLKIWKQEYLLGILKDNTQFQELEKILKEFNREKIESVVLKGFNIKLFYPKRDMRTMGDIDILVPKSKKKSIEELMEKLGYSKGKYASERETAYKKKPLMNVEIHTSLFDEDSKYYEYFSKLSNLERVELIGEYRYKFSEEDSFIYNFVHLVAHFSYRGTGIRSIIDQWLYTKKSEALDWNYINIQLKNLGLYDFYRNIISLGEFWFGNGESNERIERLGKYIMDAGLYGTMENYGVIKISKNGRIKSISLLLFPSVKFMQERFPILKTKLYLLPIYYVVRWLRVFEIQGIKSIKKVLTSIILTKKDELKKRKEFFKDIGLE